MELAELEVVVLEHFLLGFGVLAFNELVFEDGVFVFFAAGLNDPAVPKRDQDELVLVAVEPVVDWASAHPGA